ncbi:MAG TPA: hypothetical protein VNT75_13575 [Symbiobacteriaceae bacterium]|nr:hypothetical protein [Symbiobacteriaceae bacterium]
MKRLVLVVVCLVLAAGCVVAKEVPAPAVPPVEAPAPAPPPAPAAQETAVRFPGRLAYARTGELLILDGATGREIRVGSGTGPAWSHDGQWLAYGQERVHMIRPDGTGLVTFEDLPPAKWFKWSPGDAVLAVGTFGSGTWAVRPTGTVNGLVFDPHGFQTLAWSHDGTQVACTTSDIRANPLPIDIIWIAPVEGGSQTNVLKDEQNGLYLVDWWPNGQGLFYWVAIAHAVSASMDGLPLMSMPLGGGAPRKLTTMLANDRWISWAPDRQRFLATVGGGRTLWFGKSLAICDTQACEPIPQPEGVVSLDGVWSPDGGQIAFVRAEAREFMASGEGWLETRTLWVAKPDGSGARQLMNAGTGVVSPAWVSPTQLLYAAGGGLWLIDTEGGAPVKVASVDIPTLSRLDIPYAWHK